MCPHLSIIDLGDNALTSKVGPFLGTLLGHPATALVDLCVANNSLDNAGVMALAKALKSNATLRSLDVSATHVGDPTVIAMADALSVRTVALVSRCDFTSAITVVLLECAMVSASCGRPTGRCSISI